MEMGDMSVGISEGARRVGRTHLDRLWVDLEVAHVLVLVELVIYKTKRASRESAHAPYPG